MKKGLFLVFLLIGVISLSVYDMKVKNINDSLKFKEEYEGFNGEKNDYLCDDQFRNRLFDK